MADASDAHSSHRPSHAVRSSQAGPGTLGPSHDQDRAPQVVRWDFAPDLEVLPLVRAALRHRLAEWGITEDDGHGALLVASELVINAVEHAGGRLDLTVARTGTALRIAVHDDGADAPRLGPPHPTTGRGNGLRIVDAIATHWGSTPDVVGKTVWAEVVPGGAWLGPG